MEMNLLYMLSLMGLPELKLKEIKQSSFLLMSRNMDQLPLCPLFFFETESCLSPRLECSEPRSCYRTLAWATDKDSVS